MSSLGRGDGECPACQAVLTLQAGQTFAPDHPILTRPLADLGLPRHDVVTVRTAAGRRHYLLERQ